MVDRRWVPAFVLLLSNEADVLREMRAFLEDLH